MTVSVVLAEVEVVGILFVAVVEVKLVVVWRWSGWTRLRWWL